MKKVLITGAAGGVGTSFREFAAGRYQFKCFDRKATPGVEDCVAADLTDFEALKKAAEGCDAMLHLGAHPSDADFKTVLLPSNIIGTYHAYEAARLAGIKRFVFASSVQVYHGSWGEYFKPGQIAKPDNLYGATKTYGEDMGYMYSARKYLSVICLRLGWVAIPSKTQRMIGRTGKPPKIALTARDCNEIIARALDVENVTYAVIPAFSLNAAEFCDLSPITDILGYTPQDDAIKLHEEGKFVVA